MNPNNQPTPIQPAEGGEKMLNIEEMSHADVIRFCYSLQAQLDVANERIRAENKTRIKYQDICYAVCIEVDKALGRTVQNGTGTVVSKLVDAVKEIQAQLAAARAEIKTIRAQWQMTGSAKQIAEGQRDELRKKLAEAEKNRGAAIASMNELSKFALAKEQKDAQAIDQLRAELQTWKNEDHRD